ncbi:MAG: protein translocase subunit SecF [Candidatus Marinimicrobia bacterium]|jgi:preprotein translocase subunit SecF|nr:protein translocase subunit SecF [Candidatus Neomarinimicrobiota bacterium]MDP6853072.1 protein translocase subunit SecF [Candidatus Neomarinimicrobiota bacterium]MDP6936828.1 protein translocase subunit SecF [Candidatus Neomarinimicrobiota bacterium]
MRLLSKTNVNFIGKQKFTAVLSLALIIAGLVSLFMKGGPLLSIDFTGGTVAQVKFENPVNISKLRNQLADFGFRGAEIVEFGSPEEVLIKTQFSGSSLEISEQLKTALGDTFTLRRVESVGPKIGKELQTDALFAIGLALLLILIYIAFRFDRYYALGSVMALVHDVSITLGVFSLLDFEINLSIIAAFLTIVGYSLNDTIVVFDRIRENIPNYLKKTLDEAVNISLNETLNRTVITSLTTLLVVAILFIWGGEVINLFAFALIVGVMVGTYSSIFVASPVMVYFEKRSKSTPHK